MVIVLWIYFFYHSTVIALIVQNYSLEHRKYVWTAITIFEEYWWENSDSDNKIGLRLFTYSWGITRCWYFIHILITNFFYYRPIIALCVYWIWKSFHEGFNTIHRKTMIHLIYHQTGKSFTILFHLEKQILMPVND